MAITITQLKEILKTQISEIQQRLNSFQSVICPHLMCDECRKLQQQEERLKDILTDKLNDKIELLNKL